MEYTLEIGLNIRNFLFLSRRYISRLGQRSALSNWQIEVDFKKTGNDCELSINLTFSVERIFTLTSRAVKPEGSSQSQITCLTIN